VSEILLTGLEAGHPMKVMAAFGLLRLATHMTDRLGRVALDWRQQGLWHPVLVAEMPVTPDELVELLLGAMQGRSTAPEWSWADDLKVPVQAFQERLKAAEENPQFAEFLAAFCSDVVINERTLETRPTALHMTGGQQRFLVMARELAASLDVSKAKSRADQQKIRASFHEALFGPWRYQEKVHSRGWDPTTEALYALRAKDPSKDDAMGVRAAVWLAHESLPLYPVVAIGGRLRTTGFVGDFFVWPVWEGPVSWAALRSLVRMRLAYPRASGDGLVAPAELEGRGIKVVYASLRQQNGYYGVFRPAQVLGFE
jgi:hypothetical protein